MYTVYISNSASLLLGDGGGGVLRCAGGVCVCGERGGRGSVHPQGGSWCLHRPWPSVVCWIPVRKDTRISVSRDLQC